MKIEQSSGNVFADLGLPNPELLAQKADVINTIRSSINQLGLSIENAAAIIEIPVDKLKLLLRGRWTDDDSLEVLQAYLSRLQRE